MFVSLGLEGAEYRPYNAIQGQLKALREDKQRRGETWSRARTTSSLEDRERNYRTRIRKRAAETMVIKKREKSVQPGI